MKRVTLILLIGPLIIGCQNMASNKNKLDIIPLDMQPNWAGINIDNLPVQFGQIIKIKDNNIEIYAIVLDFDEFSDSIWIGICFLEEGKLFGRQIPNGIINTTCLDLLDLTYIQINGNIEFEIGRSLSLNKNKIGIGSVGTVRNFSEIEMGYQYGIKQRQKKQTPFNKGLTDINSVRECYFALEKIIN